MRRNSVSRPYCRDRCRPEYHERMAGPYRHPFRQALYLRGGAAHYRNRRGEFQGGGAHAEHACPEDACGAFPQRRHHVQRGGEVYPRRARQTHRRLFQSTRKRPTAYQVVCWPTARWPSLWGKNGARVPNAERTFVYRVHNSPTPTSWSVSATSSSSSATISNRTPRERRFRARLTGCSRR